MTVIDKFKGEYRFLSNFWLVPVALDGETYASVEHAYQAAKSIDLSQRKTIQNAPTAQDAKNLGKRVLLRDGWEEMKIQTMAYLVWSKFFHHQNLTAKLLHTENSLLIEGNWWGDTFWGVCNGAGENHLGKILMQVRTDLRGIYESPVR